MPTATHDDQQYALMAPQPTAGTWQGGDGSYPVRLPDGRTAWIFGDSLIRRTDGTEAFVHNSLVIEAANGLSVDTVHGGTEDDPESFLPDQQPGSFLWPGCGFMENGALQVVAAEFQPVTGGWVKTGNQFLFAVNLPGVVLDTNAWAIYAGSVNWSQAALQTGGYTYLYGDQERVEGGWTNHYTKLARFPTGQARGYWQFWNGSSFQGNPALAADLLGPNNTPLRVTIGNVIRYANKWQTLQIDPWGQQIKMRAASNPWGPFGAEQVIYNTPQTSVYLPRGYTDGTKVQVAYSVGNARPDYVRL